MVAAPMVSAHDVTVNISGTIQDNTCTVSPDSVNTSVPMGQVAAKSFNKAGDTTPPVRFVLDLQNCGSAVSGVEVTLTGKADANNPVLLAINSGSQNVTGLGIALFDDAKTPIPINGTSKTYPLQAGATSASLVFYAQYMANGAVVQSGAANASATFTLLYP